MKYKKTMLMLVAIIISFIYLVHPYIEDKGLIENPFKEEIIRFHVRANSDKEEDQELKLKVRDEILKVMGEKFVNTRSIQESRVIIKQNMDEIKHIAEDVIKNNGEDYNISISLGQDHFPIRKYGDMVLPQGEYETLLVTIGEGRGQNWWCVMFPPLCFVDITHSVAFNIDNELGDHVLDETQPLKLKSKIVELFKKIKS